MADEAEKFRERERRMLASLRVPNYPTKMITGRLGVPQSTVTNWLTNKVFALDADAHRSGRSTRLFSARDCVLLAIASRMVAMGLPLTVAKSFATALIERDSAERFTRQMPVHGPQEFRSGIIFQNDEGEWTLSDERYDPETETEVRVKVLAADGKSKTKTFHVDKFPQIYLMIEYGAFIDEAYDEIGLPFLHWWDDPNLNVKMPKRERTK